MALSESIEYDKIEVVGTYKHVQIRKATVIKKDGAELTRSFERFVLDPGTCLLYTSPSPRDRTRSRMPSSA